MMQNYLSPIPFDKKILEENNITAHLEELLSMAEKKLASHIINAKWPIDLRAKPELLDTLQIEGDTIYIDRSPISHNEKNDSLHAIDFLVPIWTPIQAISRGQIIYLQEDSEEYWRWEKYWDMCNVVSIAHPETKTMSEYIHLRKGSVREKWFKLWDRIRKWEIIWHTGASWRMDLPHLHFALYQTITWERNSYKNIKINFWEKKQDNDIDIRDIVVW